MPALAYPVPQISWLRLFLSLPAPSNLSGFLFSHKFVSCWPSDFLRALCQSPLFFFADQQFFYQFPWRCVCVCVHGSEWGFTVKQCGCVISTLWVLVYFCSWPLTVQAPSSSLWHSVVSSVDVSHPIPTHPVSSSEFFFLGAWGAGLTQFCKFVYWWISPCYSGFFLGSIQNTTYKSCQVVHMIQK